MLPAKEVNVREGLDRESLIQELEDELTKREAREELFRESLIQVLEDEMTKRRAREEIIRELQDVETHMRRAEEALLR